MAVMRAVGDGHQLPPHASVLEEPDEYVILLDVSDFTERELSVETLGQVVTVRGDQIGKPEDAGRAFRLHERLEESFRLPDDADAGRIEVFHKHGTLELHAPRTPLVPRVLPIEHPHLRVHADAEAC